MVASKAILTVCGTHQITNFSGYCLNSATKSYTGFALPPIGGVSVTGINIGLKELGGPTLFC